MTDWDKCCACGGNAEAGVGAFIGVSWESYGAICDPCARKMIPGYFAEQQTKALIHAEWIASGGAERQAKAALKREELDAALRRKVDRKRIRERIRDSGLLEILRGKV